MAKPINMPKLSDEMTEGRIAEWMKKEGDPVKAGDIVAQVETEKATLDIEAFESGVLLGILVKPGETAPVGRPIAWIGAAGEKVPDAGAGAPAGQPDAAKETFTGGEVSQPSTQPAPPSEAKVPVAPARPSTSAPQGGAEARAAERTERGPAARERAAPSPARPERRASEASPKSRREGVEASVSSLPGYGSRPAPAAEARRDTGSGGRIIASPVARKRARERGIDLSDVEGSGPRGRVVLSDLERAPAPETAAARPAPVNGAQRGRPQAAPAPAPAPAARKKRQLPPPQELRDETIALTPMRKAIARNLNVSKPGAPHFYLETSADMRRMSALREQLEELGEGSVSYNDLLIKAVADALTRHPEVNAAWGADAIVRRGSVDIGVAVALEDGLITPVVRDADRKSVLEIAGEVRELAGRAREKKLKPEEYQGATFTISNLGMFGIEAFYAVINPPEAAILAVGAVQKVPWVDEGTGALVAMERLRLGLSCDHRVIDGATGARFLQTLKGVLESPVRLVLG
jgi:pyruvate dehydrogenase E2 component (dihydrolipoamide acetyltransferase)